MRKPKVHRHSTGQARFRINGKAYYAGKFGSEAAKRNYNRIVAEWFATNCSPTFGLEKDQFTLAELMVSYLKFAESYFGLDRNSEVHRIRYVLRLLTELYEDLPVADFGPRQYKTVRDRMIELGWARSNVNACMKRIVRMFKWGASEGLYPAAVVETLRQIPSLKKGRTAAKEAPKVEPVDETIVVKTIEFCSPVVSDMVRVQLLCGCRPGEIVKLTPAHIDRSSDIWEANLPEHKTSYRGKTRTITFGKQAQAVLMPYLERPEHEFLFSPFESEQRRRSLVPRSTPKNQGNREAYSSRSRSGLKSKRQAGSGYTTQSYGKAIRYACAKAFPIPANSNKAQAAEWRANYWWAPNRLRHTAATKFREEFGLDVAAALLGHSRIETTQNYAVNSRDKARSAMDKIG